MAEHKSRGKWNSRMTFILAAIGSAVGLGNAWRFPGLAAKHGGGTFLLIYLVMMVALGIPLLQMEIAIGRRTRHGAPESLRAINKPMEKVGWAATTNAFVIAIYYAVVFGWVIMMAVFSFKFMGMTGADKDVQASSLWADLIKTTWTVKGFDVISTPALVCTLIAWALIYWCIRNGSQSVGKVVKYTVSIPVVCLLILAIKGFTMNGAMEGVKKLFIPDFSKLSNAELWTDAAGQVFYSLSIMMAIMFAYGSFLKDDSNIAVDSIIIAGGDFLTSLLSAIVMFTTMYGVGKGGSISSSGIATAFIIYPQAIVNLTSNGVFNGLFAFVFYFCLCTLAIDSAFSIIEGVSTAISDKFQIENKKKTTLLCCIVAGLFSLIFVTGAGVAILDIVDHWCNYFNLIIVGILEAFAIGWLFKTQKVLDEVNLNAKKFKMPKWWFNATIKIIAPLGLTVLLVWSFKDLISSGFVYGASDGYTLLSNILAGWLVTGICIASGFIISLIVKKKKKNGFIERDITWERISELKKMEEEKIVK